MLKIGDFSRLTMVSIKALRYYDELGLLKPVRIDPFTGYRYYSADQLPRLHRIIVLKDMGLSLEEIARLLKDDVSISHILDLLYTKQEALKRRLEDESERLKRVKDWILEVERENKLPVYEMIIKKVPRVRVVSVKAIVPNTFNAKRVHSAILPVLADLAGYIFSSNVQIAGPLISIYDGEIAEVEEFDIEFALPVSQDIPSTEQFQCRELPGYDQAVTLIHKGGVNSGAPANKALAKWFEVNDYQIVGPRREVYLIDFRFVGPDREIIFNDTKSNYPPDEFIVEIQLPIAKA